MITDLLDTSWKHIKVDQDLLYRVAQEYITVTGKRPCPRGPNCGSSVVETWFRNEQRKFWRERDKKKAMTNPSKYRIKGGTLYIQSLGIHISNHNLTDELAELYLKENPKGARFISHE